MSIEEFIKAGLIDTSFRAKLFECFRYLKSDYYDIKIDRNAGEITISRIEYFTADCGLCNTNENLYLTKNDITYNYTFGKGFDGIDNCIYAFSINPCGEESVHRGAGGTYRFTNLHNHFYGFRAVIFDFVEKVLRRGG